TSESALAAAIAPNWKGSSTIGVKKSTVCTSARSGAIRNTPASSAVEVPTSRSACTTGGSARSIFDRSAGPSLPAQPAARARVVNRKSSGRVRAPLSPSAMGGTLAGAPERVQADRRPACDGGGHRSATSAVPRAPAAWRGDVTANGRSGTRTREPSGAPRRRTRAPSAAELADVAYPQGDARAVAPVEEGDRELATRADQVAEDGGGDLAVRAAVALDQALRLLGGTPGVVEVGGDARDAALRLEDAEDVDEAPPLDASHLLELAEVGRREAARRRGPAGWRCEG